MPRPARGVSPGGCFDGRHGAFRKHAQKLGMSRFLGDPNRANGGGECLGVALKPKEGVHLLRFR